MAPKQTTGRHELAELLDELRRVARMTQKQLAEASGISVRPIKSIEAEGRVPKAPTLKAIADGLATYAEGRRDDALAADYYARLIRAAGYTRGEDTTPPPAPVPDPLIERLRRVFGPQDVNVITDWLDETAGYAPEDKAFTVATVEWFQQLMRSARQYRGARGPSPSAGRSFAPQGTR